MNYENLERLAKLSGIKIPDLEKLTISESNDNESEITQEEWDSIPTSFKDIRDDENYVLVFNESNKALLKKVKVKGVTDSKINRGGDESDKGDPKDKNKNITDNVKESQETPEDERIDEKKDRTPVDIGSGMEVVKVGHDTNGNWSYWVRRGDKTSKVQHTANLSGRKAISLEELSRNKALHGEIVNYMKKHVIKESESTEESDDLVSEANVEDATTFTNRGPVDDHEEAKDRFGITNMRDESIKVPAAVNKQIAQRIKELKQSIRYYDRKGYNDGQGANSNKIKAIDALEQIKDHLNKNNLEGLKQAQIYFGTLMSPITDLLPGAVVNYIVNGDEDHDYNYMQTVEVGESVKLTENKKINREKLKAALERHDTRKVAKLLIDTNLRMIVGVTSSDLPDTATFMNGLDATEEALKEGDIEGAISISEETAREMLEDEGYRT